MRIGTHVGCLGSYFTDDYGDSASGAFQPGGCCGDVRMFGHSDAGKRSSSTWKTGSNGIHSSADDTIRRYREEEMIIRRMERAGYSPLETFRVSTSIIIPPGLPVPSENDKKVTETEQMGVLVLSYILRAFVLTAFGCDFEFVRGNEFPRCKSGVKVVASSKFTFPIPSLCRK